MLGLDPAPSPAEPLSKKVGQVEGEPTQSLRLGSIAPKQPASDVESSVTSASLDK